MPGNDFNCNRYSFDMLVRFLLPFFLVLASVAGGQIATQRVPNGGLAPQAVTDTDGHLHLIYFKGDPSHGDIFYVRSNDGGMTFTQPIQVNSQSESALIIGTVRCPQIAVGRGNRMYVAWGGSSVAQRKAKTDLDNKTPVLYARLNDAGTAFEPQRNVISEHAGLDGGGSIAADVQGHVYIAWQVFDHTGRPTKAGAANDLPAWSQPAVFAKVDGSFGIIY